MRRWQLIDQSSCEAGLQVPDGLRHCAPTFRAARALQALTLLLLAGCGGVKIAPTPVLPKALIQAVPARIGYVLPPDQKDYAHNETRAGVPWSVSLGEGQRVLARAVFKAMFSGADEFEDVDAARRAEGLQAIFEARIEQYSFCLLYTSDAADE